MNDETTHDETAGTPPARVRLDALIPARDHREPGAAAKSIAADAMRERLRLRAEHVALGVQRGVLAGVAAWSRPALAAAAVIVLIAGATLLLVPTPSAAAPASLAESAGVAAPLVTWATGDRAPSAAELIDAFDPPRTPAVREPK